MTPTIFSSALRKGVTMIELPDSATFAAALAEQRLYVAMAVAALAGLVRGFSGFGAALTFIPLASMVYDPRVSIVALWVVDALGTLPFWLSVAGIALAWFFYLVRPDLPAALRARSGVLVTILEEKYGLDRLYDFLFARGARNLGTVLWRYGDVNLIDGLMVNGSARLVGWFSGLVRGFQSGYVYHYAFSMIIGVFVILSWWLYCINYPT